MTTLLRAPLTVRQSIVSTVQHNGVINTLGHRRLDRLKVARSILALGRQGHTGVMTSSAADLLHWFESLDPTQKVVSRHHTVPQFYVKRWADEFGQTQMYSRDTSEFFKRNITHLGVRHFCTIVTIDGELDSCTEDMLSDIEGQAAAIFQGLLSSLSPLSVLSEQQATDLAVFICFQMVRGPRHRRELEVMADWHAKTQLSGQVEDEQLRQTRMTGALRLEENGELVDAAGHATERPDEDAHA